MELWLDYLSIMSDIRRHDEQRRVEQKNETRRLLTIFCRKISILTVLIAVIVSMLYITLAGVLFSYQTDLIYWNHVPPMRQSLGEGWHIQTYVSQSSSVEYAAYVYDGEPDKPTVIYLHGRGENFHIINNNIDQYLLAGWTIIAPEYPGFAGLKGTPSQSSISLLIDRVYDDIITHGTDPQNIVIHGNSLGSGPALIMAQKPHGQLILSAPIARLDQVMKHFAVFYPSFLLRDKWDNLKLSKQIYHSPAVIVHAFDDNIVPVQQGRALSEEIGSEYLELETGGHSISAYAASRYAILRSENPLNDLNPKTKDH